MATLDASGNYVLYINGVANGSGSSAVPPDIGTDTLQLGASKDTTYNDYYSGLIDEYRISKVVRSSAWIATEYNNQSAPGSFFSEGSQQSQSSAGGSQVIAVTFNPSPGTYTLGQLISISTPTTGATIRYTTDGSTPSETNGTVYTGPLAFSANVLLNAIAYKSGLTDSPITSGPYTIQNSWGGTPYVTYYTYDILNHLILVCMPRGGSVCSGTSYPWQTRTFNYTSGTTVGALLLSATNPENGTVTYTYNSNMLLATKTDAKGQQFAYSYDSYNRLTQLSVGGTVLRTYVYDGNSDDPTYSQNPFGRLTEIKYLANTYSSGSTTFTDMFSYTQPGQITGKRLRVNKVSHNQPAVGDLNMSYTYDFEGKVTNITYPNSSGNSSYNYAYDSMHRLNGMTDTNGNTVVNGIQYNPANQLTNITYYGATETRVYNSLLQMTSIATTVPGGTGVNVSYNYTPGGNIGKITSITDGLTGEQVIYQYDALNRLISAAGSGWAQTQTYDGFGNLTARTGYGAAQSTTISTGADATTNRLPTSAGYSYDANGNLLSTGYGYDAENRIVSANANAINYAYDGQNKRIWQASMTGGDLSSDTVNLFGADGKQISTYSCTAPWDGTTHQLTITCSAVAGRVYFGGKMVGQVVSGTMQAAVQDRLGSVGKYYPYGEERNTPQLPNDTVKFATYTRDSATQLDYADQRYYASALGRFMTPDRHMASGSSHDPGGWNRYAYVGGDPINFSDPGGRERIVCDDQDADSIYDGSCDGASNGVDGGGSDGYGCLYSVDTELLMALVASGGGGAGGTSDSNYCINMVYTPLLLAAAATAPPAEDCDIKEQFATIPGTLHVGVHTYLDVEIDGAWSVLEVTSSTGNPLSANAQMEALITPGLGGGLSIDDPANNKTVFDAKKDTNLTSQQLCDDAKAIMNAAQSFQDNHAPGTPGAVPYNFFASHGLPNSNSFIRYLLTFAPNLGNVPHAKRARGWSNLVLGR